LGTGFIHADARASLIALLVALCAGGACSDEKAPAAARNILLITVDTLRADHLGIYGYERPTSPAIDRWFEDARIYESAYSTEANTSPSVVSILTGLPPQRHGVRFFFQKLSPEIRILPDYLRDHGYLTAAVVSNTTTTSSTRRRPDGRCTSGAHRAPRTPHSPGWWSVSPQTIVIYSGSTTSIRTAPTRPLPTPRWTSPTTSRCASN